MKTIVVFLSCTLVLSLFPDFPAIFTKENVQSLKNIKLDLLVGFDLCGGSKFSTARPSIP